ncbi:hypothetical protein NPIL_213511 [Nephila pilipes]|uniref:Uncharacterized protein n=1 Tax=Nephila pilipes TaxID=299642 RepID=A0A8X6Q029_NEPPI|nr:hypothetical protein NPIL_213511 [Nephila pilipes]
MQHEDAYSHVCHIESRYMDRESDFYKGAYGLYLAAKEAAEEADGEYLSFPKCPIPGCPLHTQLTITPEKRSKTINFDKKGFQTPPFRKQAKRKIIETSNKFKNLKLQNEMSESQTIQEENENKNNDTEMTIKNQLPPPIMLKITKNYKQQLKELTLGYENLRTKLSGEYIKLYVDTSEQYRSLTKYLRQTETAEYYVIKPKQERPIRVCLKGLPRDTDMEDIQEDLIELAAVANKPQQRAPRDSDIPTQTEAGRNREYRYNTDNRPRPAENNHSDNFYHAIELIANLDEIFNKLPGLIKHLPSIKAAKGAENKKYALIEALMDEENEIGITL